MYVASYPDTVDLRSSHADDFTVAASHSDIGTATSIVAAHARDVEAWAIEYELHISAQKSSVTLFTLKTQQSRLHPSFPLEGTVLPLDRNSKILGVIIDPYLYFHKNVEAVEVRTKQWLSILKALTGTSWGQ